MEYQAAPSGNPFSEIIKNNELLYALLAEIPSYQEKLRVLTNIKSYIHRFSIPTPWGKEGDLMVTTLDPIDVHDVGSLLRKIDIEIDNCRTGILMDEPAGVPGSELNENISQQFANQNVIMVHPTAFISYAWENETHKEWVRTLATRLRSNGVDVNIDIWLARPGEYLTQMMEKAISESQFILMICTPEYKRKSDNRIAGVGYEGHIISAGILNGSNQNKYIPILKDGDWEESLPTAYSGKYTVDLRNSANFEENYQQLLQALHDDLPKAPPLGTYKRANGSSASSVSIQTDKPKIPMPKIRKEYTDKDKRDYLYASYDTIANYFSDAVDTLNRQHEIDTHFEKINSRHFTAELFFKGKSINICHIWISTDGISNGILYSEGSSFSGKSYNENILVKEEDNNLVLDPMMIELSFGYRSKEYKNTNAEKIAEYLWLKFTSRLEYA